ncbi:MAG TPA: hypothetical protein VIJ94_03960 [Caulobacteraceae bacterium]
MLFAVAIQLSAEAVFAARAASYLLRFQGYGGSDPYLWWFGPRTVAYIERDVGVTLMGLATAASIEISWRIWERIRNERLADGGMLQ